MQADEMAAVCPTTNAILSKGPHLDPSFYVDP